MASRGQIFLDVVQGMLTSLATSMTAATREEERAWWHEDCGWRDDDRAWKREEDRPAKLQEQQHRQLLTEWHKEDKEQLHLHNARRLWLRFVEKNRRDVEEKTEQLRAISNISALFGLCAVVTLTQLSVDMSDPTTAPPLWLVGLCALTIAITECLMILAMVICALLLCIIVKFGKTYVNEDAEDDFIRRCSAFCRQPALSQPQLQQPPWQLRTPQQLGRQQQQQQQQQQVQQQQQQQEQQQEQQGLEQQQQPPPLMSEKLAERRPPHPKHVFEVFWTSRCESSWLLAFNCCSWGVSVFFVSLITVGWIQFSPALMMQASSIATLALALVVWSVVQYAWGWYWQQEGRRGSHYSRGLFARNASASPSSLSLSDGGAPHTHAPSTTRMSAAAPLHSSQQPPYGGFSGLPFDWHNAPSFLS